MWVHVDAAYAGSAWVVPEYRYGSRVRYRTLRYRIPGITVAHRTPCQEQQGHRARGLDQHQLAQVLPHIHVGDAVLVSDYGFFLIDFPG